MLYGAYIPQISYVVLRRVRRKNDASVSFSPFVHVHQIRALRCGRCGQVQLRHFQYPRLS